MLEEKSYNFFRMGNKIRITRELGNSFGFQSVRNEVRFVSDECNVRTGNNESWLNYFSNSCDPFFAVVFFFGCIASVYLGRRTKSVGEYLTGKCQ